MGNPGVTDALARFRRKLVQDFEHRAIERHAMFSAGLPGSEDAASPGRGESNRLRRHDGATTRQPSDTDRLQPASGVV
jgi:hypothetical protein